MSWFLFLQRRILWFREVGLLCQWVNGRTGICSEFMLAWKSRFLSLDQADCSKQPSWIWVEWGHGGGRCADFERTWFQNPRWIFFFESLLSTHFLSISPCLLLQLSLAQEPSAFMMPTPSFWSLANKPHLLSSPSSSSISHPFNEINASGKRMGTSCYMISLPPHVLCYIQMLVVGILKLAGRHMDTRIFCPFK